MNLDDEIATLARSLQGAIDVARIGGVEWLPRPAFARSASAPPPSPTPTPKPARSSAQAPTPAAPPASPALPPPPMPAPAPVSTAAPLAAPTATTSLPIVSDEIGAIVSSSASAAEKLARLHADVIGECKRCKLHRGRNKLVFGVGNPEADLVFVGEAPGADEDRQGIPFVGRAGQLLTKMIEAMQRKRDDVYICNVVKCRPPNNRDPEPDEVAACEPFLKAQLAILQPKVIVTLGRHAAHTLLRVKTPMTKLRGTWQEYEGIPVMPTYHPSYLLREEDDPEKKRKREAWADLKSVMAFMNQ